MEQRGEEDGKGESKSYVIAPFVLKTYEMVSDPSTDHLINWGRANNSFVVVEPLEFSQRLLPSYFKHNNFSSFVRQLNTYGFRKVDPDNWEFANEWFLRGQKQLLRTISRRKQRTRPYYQPDHQLEQLDEQSLLAEIQQLREEQKALDEEVKGMNRRLEVTERRPQQMMEFLSSVSKDPDLFTRVVVDRGRALHICDQGPTSPDKRRRLLTIPVCSSSSSIARSNNSEDERTNFSTISSPSLEVDAFGGGSSSLDAFGGGSSSLDACNSPDSGSFGRIQCHREQYIWDSEVTYEPTHLASTPSPNSGTHHDRHVRAQIPNYMTSNDDNPSLSYPFSLLGGGF